MQSTKISPRGKKIWNLRLVELREPRTDEVVREHPVVQVRQHRGEEGHQLPQAAAPGRLPDPADVEASCEDGRAPHSGQRHRVGIGSVHVSYRVSTKHAYSPQKIALNTQRSQPSAFSKGRRGR